MAERKLWTTIKPSTSTDRCSDHNRPAVARLCYYSGMEELGHTPLCKRCALHLGKILLDRVILHED